MTNSLQSIAKLADDSSLNDNSKRQKIKDKLKELRDKRLKLVQSEILLYDHI